MRLSELFPFFFFFFLSLLFILRKPLLRIKHLKPNLHLKELFRSLSPLFFFFPTFYIWVWFSFVQAQQRATGKMLGFFREGVVRFYKPKRGSCQAASEPCPGSPAPPFARAEIPFQPTPALR